VKAPWDYTIDEFEKLPSEDQAMAWAEAVRQWNRTKQSIDSSDKNLVEKHEAARDAIRNAMEAMKRCIEAAKSE
jgi:hypothetical protein